MQQRLLAFREQVLGRYPASSLKTLASRDVSIIAEQHPGVPEDYLMLLRVVGWGSIGDGAFMIYGGPIPAGEIFGPVFERSMSGVLLVGDDFAGGHAAYATASGRWSFVEIEHTRPTELLSGSCGTFVEYLEEWLGNA